MCFSGIKDVPCTPLVKQAVEAVRQQRIASDASGSHSVETENDIDTLLAYEIHLRQKIKQELQAQASSPVAPAPAPLLAPAVDVKQQRSADSVSANAPLSGFLPKQETYWDCFVGLVNALIASIKKLFDSVFGKSAASSTLPPGAGGVVMNAPAYGFFSNMNQPAASEKLSTKDLVP